MKSQTAIQTMLMVLCWGLISACGTGNSSVDAGDNLDGGMRCVSDQDCTGADTCQSDGYCRYINPEANQASGTFDLLMNSNEGDSAITGKLDSKAFVLTLGGYAELNEIKKVVHIEILGILTSNLLSSLVLDVPKDLPLNQEIHFGPGGVATGSYDLVEVNSEYEEVGRETAAYINSGYINFSAFSLSNNQAITGELSVYFRSIQ